MPTYRQAHFIRRALESLLAQTLDGWDLVIVSDGPDDATAREVAPYVGDPRVRLLRLPERRGLGAALNAGLAATAGDLVAYLPSDDIFFAGHLESLVEQLNTNPPALLAFAGVRHHRVRESRGAIEGYRSSSSR